MPGAACTHAEEVLECSAHLRGCPYCGPNLSASEIGDMTQQVPHSDRPSSEAEMERLLREYIDSYSTYFRRPESKILQRVREQMYQENDMEPLVSQLERLYGPLDGAKVLELGSGSGSRAVAVALRGAEVAGIEPSEAGVIVSKMRAARYPDARVSFQVGFGEDLQFPDSSFDLIFSAEVLQCVQSLPKVMSESYRVLRPGGRIYHETSNYLYPWEFNLRMFWIPGLPKPLGKLYLQARGKDPRHLDHINFMYRHSLFALLRRQGFEEIGDLYVEKLARKAKETDDIRSSSKRKLFGMMKGLGIADLGLRAATTIGVYPGIWVHARKPV
jgi:SAM-dependent methyltransferase